MCIIGNMGIGNIVLDGVPMKSLEGYSYPKFSYIRNIRPNPAVLLGHTIYWTEKRDGSCLGVSTNSDTDTLMIRSRHREHAANDLVASFMDTGVEDSVRELIAHLREWHVDPVVFGELMKPGKSPARFEIHAQPEFAVFDIYDAITEKFLSYPQVYSKCFQNDVPVVELYGRSVHNSLDSLYDYRDTMLDKSTQHGREGVVGKVWDKPDDLRVCGHADGYIYFKEKRDAIKIPLHVDDNPRSPQLPPLPESEIISAIAGVKDEMGDDFYDVSIAMPKVANVLRQESVKHCCSPVQNMFNYYRDVVES